MNKLLSSVILVLFALGLNAQDAVVIGTKRVTNPNLYKKFSKVDQYEINIENFRKQLEPITKVGIQIEFQLDQKKINLSLFEYDMFKSGAKVRIETANGLVVRDPSPELRTFRGIETGFNGGNAALTISKDYLSLMYYQNGVAYFLEQYLGDDPSATVNTFFHYADRDVLPVPGIECGFDKLNKARGDHKHEIDEEEGNVEERNKRCYIIDIALACEVQYTNFHRGPFGAEAAMVNVQNFMAIDWVNNLWDEYQYALAEIYISEDPARDLWRNAGDIFEHLEIFRFRQSSLFPGGFDVATLWTVKFTSGIVGLAMLPGACTPNGVNVCSEFTQGIILLKQLQSHELGHNFDCTHDPAGSPTIMAPVVNGSGIWSFQSQNQISNYTRSSGGCLSDCGGGRIPIAEFEANPTYGCVPFTVRYTNLSVNAQTYKWTFSGGIPATSTDPNPVVVYNSKGVFDVTLEAMNPQCTVKVTKDKYIETNDLPTADFNGGNTQDDRVVLFVNNSRNATEYFWEFGDGNTSEEFMPEHEYAKDSTYRVCLKSSNDCGSKTVCKTISVFTFPVADFEADTTGGCAPKTIKFFDRSSSNVIAWNWEFPGGTPSTSTQPNPTVKYSNPGQYAVKLTVNTKKFFTRTTKEKYITIDSLPAPAFSHQINGADVDFTNQSRYAVSHEWDFGDNTSSTDENPTHTYTAAGRYEVIYRATNGCGTTQTKTFITIGAKPTAGFTTKDPVGCAPYTVQFENTSTASATNFEWSFPGGIPSSSTDRNPVVTYPIKGKYDVRLIARNALERDTLSISQFIEVKQAPTASFQNSITGFNVFFNNMSQEASNYFWDFGDNKTSTEISPSHNYGVEGEFNVKLIVENECGIDTFEKLIAVYLIPKVNFSADTIRGCAPLNVRFSDRSSIDVIEWSWQFEEGMPGTSVEKNPIVRFNKAGFYTVKLSVKNTNGTNSETKVRYIEVLSPILCPKKPSKKGPKSTGDDGILEVDMGARSNGSVETKVFPNPTNSTLHIQTREGTRFQLVDLTGKAVRSGITQSTSTSLDVTDLMPGSYFIRLEHAVSSQTLKVLISK